MIAFKAFLNHFQIISNHFKLIHTADTAVDSKVYAFQLEPTLLIGGAVDYKI